LVAATESFSMTKLNPSVQLYTLRDAVAEDLENTLSRVAEIGFTQVEPYGFVDRVDEYEVLLSKFGLKAPTGHAQLIGQGDKVHVALKAAKSLGMETLIDPFTLPDEWEDKSRVDFFISELNSISEIAREYGVRIGYHNHNWELAKEIDGQIAFDYFISKLNPEIVIELDTYWCEVGGQSAPEYLKKHADRIVAIHVKDGTKDGDRDKQVPAGQGEIPVAEILAAASAKVLPVVEFDFFTSGEVFDGITQSLAYIKEQQA
jgi:sugar phosphate isomerase/epimerase